MLTRLQYSLIALTAFYILMSLLIGFEAALALFISCSLWSLVFRGHLDFFTVMNRILGESIECLSSYLREFARR